MFDSKTSCRMQNSTIIIEKGAIVQPFMKLLDVLVGMSCVIQQTIGNVQWQTESYMKVT